MEIVFTILIIVVVVNIATALVAIFNYYKK